MHIAQLMPLPLTVSCFSKIQIGFTFLVLAHLGSPRKRAVKWVCVCVCVSWLLCLSVIAELFVTFFVVVAPRRNEAVFGTKAIIGKQAAAVPAAGDDGKTFQAAIVEYTEDQRATKVHCPQCSVMFILYFSLSL